MRLLILILFVLVLAPLAPAGDEDLLVGTWLGADGTRVVLTKDGSGSLNGQALEWKAWGKGRLRVKSAGETLRGTYVVSRDQLSVTIDGEVMRYRREGEPQPKAAPKPEPRPDQGADAPAKPSAPGQRFEGSGVVLELRSVPPGLEGQLERDGQVFPVRAVRHGERLYGAYLGASQVHEFVAFPGAAGVLRLELEGQALDLKPSPLRPSPDPLEGVSQVKGQRWNHPRGWFSFEMPAGWSVAREAPDGLWLNPGLREGDDLAALILLQFGELDEENGERSPVELLDRYEAEVRRGWRAEGVQLEQPKGGARSVLVSDAPGAVQEWNGRAGSKPVSLWLGGITKRNAYLTVGALMLQGKESRYLPLTKRIFATLEASPPRPNPILERMLVESRFRVSETSSSGFYGTVYDFRADGSVKRETLMSGGGVDLSVYVSSDIVDWGTYEVDGDQVFVVFPNETELGNALVESGELSGIRFGGLLYLPM